VCVATDEVALAELVALIRHKRGQVHLVEGDLRDDPHLVRDGSPEWQSLAETRAEDTQRRQAEIQRAISERNARFFEGEAEKLDTWADDLKLGLEREIKEMDRQIKEARRAATTALTLEEKLAGQKHI